jgi:hypothetical protein
MLQILPICTLFPFFFNWEINLLCRGYSMQETCFSIVPHTLDMSYPFASMRQHLHILIYWNFNMLIFLERNPKKCKVSHHSIKTSRANTRTLHQQTSDRPLAIRPHHERLLDYQIDYGTFRLGDNGERPITANLATIAYMSLYNDILLL